MNHLRLLICRVDEETDQMVELDRLDLPPMTATVGAAPLDTLEARVAQVGPRGSGGCVSCSGRSSTPRRPPS